MIKKAKTGSQLNFLLPGLADQLDKNHGLYKLASVIDWRYFDQEFEKHYCDDFGRPSKPIRLMVSLLILKQVRNLSDESVVEQWSENNYYQYFSGQREFVPEPPCAATELVNFRKRIGPDGVEKILKESIRINGKDSEDEEATADTTVQEKNITFPTDAKLHIKIIHKCWDICEKEGIELRQSYRRILPQLRYQQRGRHHPTHVAKARKADRKIKTIAGRLVRELERKLPSHNPYNSDLELFHKVLNQKRHDSNKIYSLHEPDVNCISKGKEHKKFEFGNKVSILKTRSGVIVGAVSFDKNVYDGKTLHSALEQHERLVGKELKRVNVDLGYRGQTRIGSTEVISPAKKTKGLSDYRKRRHKKAMRERSSIEPIIGHLKSDHRLGRNYLKGIKGDAMNLMLAAAAFNFRRFMRQGWNALCQLLYYILWIVIEPQLNPLVIPSKMKRTF